MVPPGHKQAPLPQLPQWLTAALLAHISIAKPISIPSVDNGEAVFGSDFLPQPETVEDRKLWFLKV